MASTGDSDDRTFDDDSAEGDAITEPYEPRPPFSPAIADARERAGKATPESTKRRLAHVDEVLQVRRWYGFALGFFAVAVWVCAIHHAWTVVPRPPAYNEVSDNPSALYYALAIMIAQAFVGAASIWTAVVAARTAERMIVAVRGHEAFRPRGVDGSKDAERVVDMLTRALRK